ncbi:MAG: glycosyltransferase family 9 protein [Rhodospirillales bacterium]|nr:glycosyltransferase family 9 protein [Rhodospirillales bacterium]
MTKDQPASVLVYVGLDRVGDGLLKLPFVRGLREAFPETRITWLAGKETSVYASVLAPLTGGLLDEVIENAGIGLHPSELLRRPLDGRRFDLVIDTQRIFWASLSLWRIPHKTFISPAARFLLSSRKPPAGYTFPKSMQRQMLDLLELASGRDFATPAFLELPVDPGHVTEAACLLPDGPVYIGFAPGSGGLPKCWPLENFIALARQQVEKGRTPVFFLGPQEEDWRVDIQAAVPDALFPLQTDSAGERHGFAPQFTIALGARTALNVSNDSGVGHMLAIGTKPLVSLFGPTVPEKFMPMGDKLTIIRAADFGGREMALIPLEVVREAVEAGLQGAAGTAAVSTTG